MRPAGAGRPAQHPVTARTVTASGTQTTPSPRHAEISACLPRLALSYPASALATRSRRLHCDRAEARYGAEARYRAD
jgi:hypothetical protein